MIRFDKRKSLEELENKVWGGPNFESHLVQECHRLRRVPLKDFTVEDLRILIGQNICLNYLVPLALERLQKDPLAEGAFYQGDVLCNVLRADSRFWIENPELEKEVAQIAERAFAETSALNEIERKSVEEPLKDAYELFQRAAYFAGHGRS